jgi:hypothetical protein
MLKFSIIIMHSVLYDHDNANRFYFVLQVTVVKAMGEELAIATKNITK